jgi:hypothetical protein
MGELYDDASTFGLLVARIVLIFGAILGLILSTIGIWYMVSKVPEATPFKITAISDNTITLEGGYIVLRPRDFSSKIGDTVQGYKIHGMVGLDKSFLKTEGGVLLSLGVMSILGSYLSWYLANHFKFFAASEGIATALKLLFVL